VIEENVADAVDAQRLSDELHLGLVVVVAFLLLLHDGDGHELFQHGDRIVLIVADGVAVAPFVEEEVVDEPLDAVVWKLEARISVDVTIRGGVLADARKLLRRNAHPVVQGRHDERDQHRRHDQGVGDAFPTAAAPPTPPRHRVP